MHKTIADERPDCHYLLVFEMSFLVIDQLFLND